jgi:hypothetical protein
LNIIRDEETGRGRGLLETMKDVLRSSEMGLTRVMHVKAHLLDCVGDVRPGER